MVFGQNHCMALYHCSINYYICCSLWNFCFLGSRKQDEFYCLEGAGEGGEGEVCSLVFSAALNFMENAQTFGPSLRQESYVLYSYMFKCILYASHLCTQIKFVLLVSGHSSLLKIYDEYNIVKKYFKYDNNLPTLYVVIGS